LFPHLSNTWNPSALSHTIGGCPIIDRGSDSDRDSKTGIDSGTGILVLIVLYFVFTSGTLTGSRLYFAMMYRLLEVKIVMLGLICKETEYKYNYSKELYYSSMHACNIFV